MSRELCKQDANRPNTRYSCDSTSSRYSVTDATVLLCKLVTQDLIQYPTLNWRSKGVYNTGVPDLLRVQDKQGTLFVANPWACLRA